jgi:hypothetical protein
MRKFTVTIEIPEAKVGASIAQAIIEKANKETRMLKVTDDMHEALNDTFPCVLREAVQDLRDALEPLGVRIGREVGHTAYRINGLHERFFIKFDVGDGKAAIILTPTTEAKPELTMYTTCFGKYEISYGQLDSEHPEKTIEEFMKRWEDALVYNYQRSIK